MSDPAAPAASGSSQITGSPLGQFVWHDYMATDADAAVEFYSSLFGWKTKRMELPVGIYTMLLSGGEPVGGVMSLDASHGLPSHWMSYATVDDVDAACSRAEASGGTVVVPPFDMSGAGRGAVIRDPQGAYISPFMAIMPGMARGTTPGTFVWDELATTDPEAAVKFYGSVFGWGSQEMDMGEMGTYWLHTLTEKEQAGGMMHLPPDSPAPPHWLPYVHVTDTDATVARARELGAEVMLEPVDVEMAGRLSIMLDPLGASFAVLSPAMPAA